ncbi:MAG TPA: M67 family metallopeptidase, partial [Candidatus Solibacter sp.]|nr:M67 family metallopeptidase [Candidatus Solibacter sp.]
MIRIESEPWAAMVAHAREAYPNECCGAMLGVIGGDKTGGDKAVRVSMRLENSYAGAQAARYELRPEDLLAADKAARERQMDLIGIYHSHPDCD